MTIPYHVGPDCQLSGKPFLDLIPRTRWQDLQCCTTGPGYECGCPLACTCRCPECACGPEVICDGGRPLWPERWSVLRHGTWNYRVSIVGLDDAEVTFGPPGPTVRWSWYSPPSRKLCIDGREYRRRQRARAKRRRR